MTRANGAGQNIPEKKLADRTKKADPPMTENHVTKEQLGKLCSLKREIARAKRRLARLENKLTRGQMDAELYAEAMRTQAALRAYLIGAQTEETRLIRYIDSIPDSDIRELFMLRYVDGIRSWQRIAFLAGEHDESYVRRRHNAYLKKHPTIE